jgi:type II secretory pathway predicted ATPase ExeA
MYESYFDFSESPFENNLDHRFLFVSEDHKEVLAALSYFIKTKKGFAIVCGDVGTGKTMLINSFLSTLPEYVQPIIIANPGVSSLELLRYIAKTLKIEVEEKDGILELTDAVKDLLKNAKSSNKQFVLIIDEAHLLSDQALEEIRLLSNIETQEQKLLQILLVGQYELSYKLDRPEMRHLRQRININRFLSPMSSSETLQYVDHRLKQVGSSFSAIFEDNCGSAIYKITRGVPRNINQLCDNALLICMSEKQQKVDRRMLRKAQEALLTDRIFTPKFAQRTRTRRHQLPKVLEWTAICVLWTAVCATFLALGIVLSQIYLPGKMVQQTSPEASLLTGSVPDPKAASAVPSGSVGSPEQPSKVAEPVGLPARVKQPERVKQSDASSDNTLKPASRRREVKEGDTLSIIASQVYSGSEDFGLEAVLFDNPEIKNRDLIHPGQVVFLPRIKPNGQIMQLRDNLFYAYYGRYDSDDAMKRVTALLEQKGVKYTGNANAGRVGRASRQILLGGYETAADLQKALELVKANK